jgi:hypothetical protein
LMCSGRESSSCSTSGTHRVNLVANPVISREWGKDREVLTTSGTYPWSFVTHLFHYTTMPHSKLKYRLREVVQLCFIIKEWQTWIEIPCPRKGHNSSLRKCYGRHHELVDRNGINVSHRRRTDNTKAKRKSTKGQTTIDKSYI